MREIPAQLSHRDWYNYWGTLRGAQDSHRECYHYRGEVNVASASPLALHYRAVFGYE